MLQEQQRIMMNGMIPARQNYHTDFFAVTTAGQALEQLLAFPTRLW